MSAASLPDLIRRNEERYRLTLDQRQREGIAIYLENLERWRRQISLTTLSNPSELLHFHFFEAFWAADQFLTPGATFADVGSGTGFPGLAIVLRHPDFAATLIEPNQKKAVFLADSRRRLGLACPIFTGTGENFARWGEHPLATLRALKPSADLLKILRSHHVSLLHFRGRETDPALQTWSLVKEHPVPDSENRWVSLYTPQ